MKLIGITSILIVIFFTMLSSKDKYKEPSFTLLESKGNIEIRQYSEYIVAKTSIIKNNIESDNNMFRVLASYIFGGNEKNASIPMTAPVTTFEDNESYSMLFYMLESDKIKDLPITIIQGRHDVICPPFAAFKLKENLNNCELIIVENSGHSAFEKGIKKALLDSMNQFKEILV